MAKSIRATRRRHRQAGVGQLVALGHGSWRLRAVPRPPDLSRRARARLTMIEWHHANGANVSLTARRFGFSRPTVYRWLGRFDQYHLASLEDRPSQPHHRRHHRWTVDQAEAVQRLRERYPRWGKAKLRVLLGREGMVLSVSMVGRILTGPRRRGALREPHIRRVSVRRRTWSRPWAVRKPAGWGGGTR